jgi:hypothetical protein
MLLLITRGAAIVESPRHNLGSLLQALRVTRGILRSMLNVAAPAGDACFCGLRQRPMALVEHYGRELQLNYLRVRYEDMVDQEVGNPNCARRRDF